MMESELERLAWDGCVPISVEHSSASTLHLLVPRRTYLHHVAPKILSHFGQTDGPTLQVLRGGEDAAVELKWHLPVGVIFDLFSKDGLPLKLGIGQDGTKILGRDATKDLFMNSLKEADYLMHGSTSAVMGLSKDDQTELWESLDSADRFETYTRIRRTLLTKTQKHLPLRLYILSNASVQVWQEPILLKKGDGELTTLNEVLDLMREDVVELKDKEWRMWSHGIEVTGETHVEWLLDLMYPDLFVHIVLKENELER